MSFWRKKNVTIFLTWIDLQKLLKTSANPKANKKKKKAAEKAVTEETNGAPTLVES